jgi:hypothetical protein
MAFDPLLQEDGVSRQPLTAATLVELNTPPDPISGETCTCLRDLYTAGALEWPEGEPAINIYRDGGYFGPHKDHLGTGFWAGNRDLDRT